MTNKSSDSYYTLREAIISLGYEWQEKDYFFCHGELPIINDAITDMKEYVGILLCADGDIDISINEVDYNLTASTLLIAHPTSIVHIIRSKRQYKGFLLFVARNFLAKNIVNAQLVKPFRQISKHQYTITNISREQQKNLIDIYKLIYRKKETKQSVFQLETLRNLFLVFICEVAEIFLKSKKVENRSTRNEEITDAFFNLLRQPLRVSDKTAFFANLLNISPKHLIKTIKNTTGKSPGIFINEKITDDAKLLLADNSLTISQISDKLGFSETSSFSKFFKKQVGISPSQFRQQL
ncbi:MAG: helix-turn-helix domain-containing protein [Lentimicrobiaceae bacterium]|nr:helix-turn-helix domain-containing protein [Lentimicrobiaceae bacterium]